MRRHVVQEHLVQGAAMSVPINRFPARQEEAKRFATHVERTYADFYRKLWQALRAPK
ncbi:hypothetical protein [Micromonospora sp. NPDC005203]|uniref:hypothetical protein n=1 Tax=Micromonospora sp. NPDC005203 TaxID=3364226 RepID=UPI0036AE63E1